MLIIENGLVLRGSDLQPKKENILVEEGTIVEITSDNLSGSNKIDAKGCIVSPSLINSHVHIGDAVAQDVGDGKSIDEIVKPPNGIKHQILAETSPELLIESMQDAMWEMLYTGTTTFVDYREGGLDGINLLKEAAKEIPIDKIILGRDDILFDPEADLNDVRSTIKNLLQHCDGIAPSGFGEIRDDVAQIIVEECFKQGKISSIHAAEHKKAQEDSLKNTGKTEVQRAMDSGFQQIVHLNYPENGDFNAVLSGDSSVVSCPRSNGALGVGIPPIMDMDDYGINMLLGTDNLMFNSPNMFREMEYALKMTRGYYKKYFSPLKILKMATANASEALSLSSGIIDEGKSADLMVVKKISQNPWLSLINRTESKNIICLMKQGNIVYMR